MQKEWSSDTELCKPELVDTCEQLKVTVKQVRNAKPMCMPSKIPKCKVNDLAEEVDICSISVENEVGGLVATTFETETIKRCNTHYVKECKPGYGYRPKCEHVPVQVRTKHLFRKGLCLHILYFAFQLCYDIPVVRPVEKPLDIEVATVKEDCEPRLIPTPETVCWDEEKMLCAAVPTLVEAEQHLNKCAPSIGGEDCQRVRLTIPREICYPVQKYHPYPPPPSPYKIKRKLKLKRS